MESILLHQYLHAWLPGSFGPATLIRPDWSSAPRAPELWLVEGVAEYYARLLPVRRTGGTSRARFYDAMGTLITVWRELGGGDRIEPAGLVGPVVRGGEEGAMPRLVAGGAIAIDQDDLRSFRQWRQGSIGPP